MTVGRAHSGGGLAIEGVLPFMEIVHNRADEDLTLTTSNQNMVWLATPGFDEIAGAVTFDAVDEVTIVDTATYKINFEMALFTTGVGRHIAFMEIDPLGVGSFAFVVLSTVLFQTSDADQTNGKEFIVDLNATDILRWRIRRLVGTGPDRTNGAFGGIWRITKMS